jgi:hypothetical protein
MMLARLSIILVLFMLSSCATEYHKNNLVNHHKVAVFYSSSDKDSALRVNDILNFCAKSKLSIRFSMIDIYNQKFSYDDQLSNLATESYTVIVSLLQNDAADELDKKIKYYDFALFSGNEHSFSYKQYINSDKFTEINHVDDSNKHLIKDTNKVLLFLKASQDLIARGKELTYDSYLKLQ